MRRITLIIVLISLYACPLPAQIPVDLFLQSEYRLDTTDYSQNTEYYYREKASVLFSRESMFNIACIIPENKERKHTWNFILKDASPYFSLILGNFFTQFGSGLLIGKQRMYEPDIFKNRVSETPATFTPCNSGNPVYSFFGTALSSNFNTGDIKFTFNLFYSINERFTNQQQYESGISSSLSNTGNNFSRDYNDELIAIHTGGFMISWQFLANIYTQIYFTNSSIKDFYNHKILFEFKDNDSSSSGIKNLSGCGFFAQYSDDFFTLLFDAAFTQKEIASNENGTRKEPGFGILYGLEFSSPFLTLSLKAKSVKSTFYSPYSSSIGESYPESCVFIDTEIKPFSNLKFFAGSSMQKKNKSSSSDDEIIITEKENAGFSYHHKMIDRFEISFRRIERNSNGYEKVQARSACNISIRKDLLLKSMIIFQKNCAERWSKLYSSGFNLKIFKYIGADFNYLIAYISENNEIYSVVSPVKDSSTSGIFIRENSNFAVSKITYKYNDIYISCRYINMHKGSVTVNNRFEFIACVTL